MTIDQQVEELLNQIDSLMQELIKNRMPCEELIKKVTVRLGITYYDYLSDVYIDVFADPAHHWISLHKLDTPHAINGEETWVTIIIDNQYWWEANYAQQLLIVQSLPKLLEKVIRQVRQVRQMTVVFDTLSPPKVKHHWWQFWRK
jgi:hypothetical protein